MSFIRNIWYVAAWNNELADRPIGRVIIGEPVVLFRLGDGTLCAMEDRCPHRHAPLSFGRIEGERIVCMYHGLQFEADGSCAHIPGGVARPDIKVRTYPVVEKDSWLWVWMGDPALADAELIPRAFGIDNDQWAMREGAIEYDANYQLVNDNLTDLSHLDFVHETTLGAASGSYWSEQPPRVITLDAGLRIDRWFTDVATPLSPSGLCDAWSSYHYWLPGIFIMQTYLYPPGTAVASGQEEPRTAPLIRRVEQQAVTPIDDKRTRYMFATGFDAGALPPEALEPVFSIVNAAFAEDKRMIEAQQCVWNRTDPDVSKAFITQDKAPAIFRRMIARRIAAEADAALGELV